MSGFTRSGSLLAAAALAAVIASPRSASAQTWSGAEGPGFTNWSETNNWFNGTVPAATGAILTFTGSSGTRTAVNNNVVTSAGRINLSNAAGGAFAGMTLAGDRIESTGTNIFVSTTTAATLVTDEIQFPIRLTLNMSHTFEINTLHDLLISGTIDQDSSARNLIKTNNGKLTLTGLNNAYSGTIGVHGGTLQVPVLGIVGAGGPLGTGNVPVRVGFQSSSGTLSYNGVGESTNKYIHVGNNAANSGHTGGARIVSDGSGPIVFTGTGRSATAPAYDNGLFNQPQANPAASRTLFLSGTNTGNNEIQSSIQNNNTSTGTVALTKDGPGKWILSGTNTYIGPTSVNAGTLVINGTTHGSSNVTVALNAILGGSGTIGGNLSFASGAKLLFNAAAPLTIAAGKTASFVDPAAFGIDDIVGLDSSVADGTYTLIAGGVTTTNLANFGSANAYNLGAGKSAYFQAGSLQVVVVPEPTAGVLGAAVGVAGVMAWRRRQSRRHRRPEIG